MCCGSSSDRWVVTYPAAPATAGAAAEAARTEEFVTVRLAWASGLMLVVRRAG